MAIVLNENFYSFQNLQEAIRALAFETNSVFIIQDSVKTKIPALKDDFIYDRVLFACRQGRGRRSTGKGQRKIRQSVKLGCSAKIRAVLKEENGTWSLVLTKVNLEHDTHTPSKEDIPTLNPDKEKLLILAKTDLEQSLCVKDIIRHKVKLENERYDSDVDCVSEQLKAIENRGGSGSLALSASGLETDGSQHLIDMVAFSTKEMIECFKSFPECILIDDSYKKNNSGYLLYRVMIKDCLGISRTVFYTFIRCDTIPILTMVLQTFAEFVGDDIKKTQVVMSRKSGYEASASQTVLPWARHLLCPWNIHAAMEKAVDNLKDDVTVKRVLNCLCKSLLDTSDPVKFLSDEKKLEELSPEFYAYYCQQWRDCKEQWAACERLTSVNFFNDANNFVVSMNCRLGKILSSTNNIACALHQLHNHGSAQMNELSQSLAKESILETSHIYAEQDFHHIYTQFFPYAAKAMITNHKPVDQLVVASTDNKTFLVLEMTRRFQVTVNENNLASCNCPFALQMTLPCVHIMACLFSGLNAQLYSENNRWLKARGHVTMTDQLVESLVTWEGVPAERRHRLKAVFGELTTVLLNSNDEQFQKRLEVLQKIVALWKDGKEVTICADSVKGVCVSEDAGVYVRGVEVAAVTGNVSNDTGERTPKYIKRE